MPFSLLNPWLLLGALAVAAPVWLHLRRKQETNLVKFSTLRFLDDTPHPNKSPLRLRDIVLFALRVLALLAVVGAFAWPYLRDASRPVVKESRVYVLDNTLSHQAGGAFAHASEKAREYVDQAGEKLRGAADQIRERTQGYAEDAQAMVRRRPAESVAVAFGAGLIVGLLVGIVSGSRD